MKWIIAKLFAVTVVLTAFLDVAPVRAQQNVSFVSATGGGTACTQTAPCGTIEDGIGSFGSFGSRVVCMTPMNQPVAFEFSSGTYVFDCPSTTWLGAVTLVGSVLKFQHINFSGLGDDRLLTVSSGAGNGNGTLIFDDCTIEDNDGAGLDVEPSVPFNLVLTNTRILNSGSGILIEPASGGSVKATFDHVTITDNSGGGVKIDSASGPVSVDVTASTISYNAGNGLNAVSGTGGAAMLNIRNSVIANNGDAGIQANGSSAAALVNNTLLDSNGTGATNAVGGGRVLTYGNNCIAGSRGSGFTGTASLQ